MEKAFRGRLCVARKTFIQGGRTHSKGHCRLQVPAAAIEAIGLKAGDQYRAARDPLDDSVVLRKAKTKNWCDQYVLKDPEAIRLEPMHVLYLDGSRIGVSSVDYPLSDVELSIEGDQIRMRVPADLPKIRRATPRPPKIAHEERQDLSEIRAQYKGAAYAVALDASRLGSKAHALEQDQLIDMLRNAGHRLAQVSPRLWSMDGKTVALPDLMDRARRIDADMILVADAA